MMVENSPSSPVPDPSPQTERPFALYDLTVEASSETGETTVGDFNVETPQATVSETLPDSLAGQGAPPASAQGDDLRMYVPDPEGWEACIKQDSDKIYCYQKNPGESYFHLIVSGEIYLMRGTEKLCLQCAHRRGVISLDRLHWQHRVKRVTTLP